MKLRNTNEIDSSYSYRVARNFCTCLNCPTVILQHTRRVDDTRWHLIQKERNLIPETMKMDMLQRIHSSHIGVEGSLRRARENLFWFGMTNL